MALSTTTKFKLFQFFTLIGCFLILLCDGLNWYWGNLSVYIASYFRVKHDIKIKVISAWTPSIFMLMWDFPALLVHFPAQRMGKRWTMLLGIVITETGFALGLVGVLYPKFPLEIGFGLFCGLGTCFTYTLSLMIAMEWTERHTCLTAAFLHVAFSLGGIITNQAVSWYINPSNEEAVQSDDFAPFFRQESINERVPKFILIFALTALLISLFGLFLLRKRFPLQHAVLSHDDLQSKNTEDLALIEKSKTYRFQAHEDRTVYSTSIELLKAKAFYVLLFGVVAADITFITSTTYYKPFGQTRITDDHFLTFVGTIPPISNAISNLVTGALIDRFGAQRPILSVCVLLSISSAFFYISLFVGKWSFFFCLQIYSTTGATLYNAVLLGLIKLFGKDNLPIKVTMLFSISLISTLSLPPLLDMLLITFGWFGLFFLSAVVSSMAVFFIIIGLPYP